MKTLLKLLSLIGLLLTVVPSLLYFSDAITLDTHKWLMLDGTVLWFGSAPFWMNEE